MIGIDMKMPIDCAHCPMDHDTYGGGYCLLTDTSTNAVRFVRRSDNCPLHFLDDEIHVGDEVCFNDGESFNGVVLDESVVNGSWCILTENGCVSAFDEKKLHRTGRHFDEVETMLKKMRGEDDA